jgi:hypothetical protein
MSIYVDFEKVLALFEKNGCKLQRIKKPYRIFTKPNDKNSLPFLIPVEGKKVHVRYYEKIKNFFEETKEGP